MNSGRHNEELGQFYNSFLILCEVSAYQSRTDRKRAGSKSSNQGSAKRKSIIGAHGGCSLKLIVCSTDSNDFPDESVRKSATRLIVKSNARVLFCAGRQRSSCTNETILHFVVDKDLIHVRGGFNDLLRTDRRLNTCQAQCSKQKLWQDVGR